MNFEKILKFSIICRKDSNEDKKICKEEKSIEVAKIFDLINNIDEYQKKHD